MKALIDLGTNTFNLMIANIDTTGAIQVIHSEKEGVALGMGGIHEKRLASDAMDRAVACLSRFKAKCSEHRVTSIRAIGTSAIRDAHNRDELIERVLREVGIHIEVISGLTEAQLIYQGVHQTMNFDSPGLIMDIGGGSTEFILADEQGVLEMESFNIGVSRIYQQFRFADPMTESDILELEAYLEQACGNYLRAIQTKVLIGASGSFETFFELMHESPFQSAGRAVSVSLPHFLSMLEAIISSSQAERDENPHIISIRKRMAPIAALKTRWVIRQLGIQHIWISPYSLKEGALLTKV
jgi:exopolyphosphatase/guanosine-5'-triphosphate,3'-diphosphate pyrophosphatase